MPELLGVMLVEVYAKRNHLCPQRSPSKVDDRDSSDGVHRWCAIYGEESQMVLSLQPQYLLHTVLSVSQTCYLAPSEADKSVRVVGASSGYMCISIIRKHGECYGSSGGKYSRARRLFGKHEVERKCKAG